MSVIGVTVAHNDAVHLPAPSPRATSACETSSTYDQGTSLADSVEFVSTWNATQTSPRKMYFGQVANLTG
jgi:hypothetical protein